MKRTYVSHTQYWIEESYDKEFQLSQKLIIQVEYGKNSVVKHV